MNKKTCAASASVPLHYYTSIPPPIPSIHIHINQYSVNLAKELFFDCSFVDSKECADSKALAQAEGGFQIIYAAGHQHVGGLSLELYNMDTGACTGAIDRLRRVYQIH